MSTISSDRENFDFDLEDIMLMEAIWLSIQVIAIFLMEDRE